MNNCHRALLSLCLLLPAASALAQVTFYEREDFRGRAFSISGQQADFGRTGFNNRASSAIVDGGRWEVCEGVGFRGNCVVLREGSYDSLSRMGVNNQISSARRVGGRDRADWRTPDPMDGPPYEYRRRPSERVYQAPVTSVRAVMGRPENHCWIERDEAERRDKPNIAGGVIGGVIGGILGHQIGGGTGKDIATAGGAVAGAAVGANVGRDRGIDRDVRHCETVQSGPPDYWDVTYEFRDIEHHVQLSSPPGRTIAVNRDGEPRDY
ncbi:MAG: beta/gamma crystallin-related protein [Steroidobacteraceae bacterium]